MNRFPRAIGKRLWIEPVNDVVFQRERKEVVASRAVVTDVVSLHVISRAEVEALVVFLVDDIHVEGAKIVLL